MNVAWVFAIIGLKHWLGNTLERPQTPNSRIDWSLLDLPGMRRVRYLPRHRERGLESKLPRCPDM
eukprot:2652988-Pyramimonas_sp.AAC.1